MSTFSRFRDPSRLLRVEHLEDKRLLTNFTVTVAYDSVPDTNVDAGDVGTLANIIAVANSSPNGPHNIYFDATLFRREGSQLVNAGHTDVIKVSGNLPEINGTQSIRIHGVHPVTGDRVRIESADDNVFQFSGSATSVVHHELVAVEISGAANAVGLLPKT